MCNQLASGCCNSRVIGEVLQERQYKEQLDALLRDKDEVLAKVQDLSEMNGMLSKQHDEDQVNALSTHYPLTIRSDPTRRRQGDECDAS